MKKSNNGILFWITGLSGSGKSTLAKKIIPAIKKRYGPTIHLDGDYLRNILNLNGYSFKERLSNTKIYNKANKDKFLHKGKSYFTTKGAADNRDKKQTRTGEAGSMSRAKPTGPNKPKRTIKGLLKKIFKKKK